MSPAAITSISYNKQDLGWKGKLLNTLLWGCLQQEGQLKECLLTKEASFFRIALQDTNTYGFGFGGFDPIHEDLTA